MVFFFSWVQTRTPQHMMGRMMSLIIFGSVGLVPFSQFLAGAVARWSVTALFVGAAVLLGLVVARAWFVPSLRAMGLEMAAREPESATGETGVALGDASNGPACAVLSEVEERSTTTASR